MLKLIASSSLLRQKLRPRLATPAILVRGLKFEYQDKTARRAFYMELADREKEKHRQKKEAAAERKAQRTSAKLRGLPRDLPEVRVSKTLSWILRHGSEQEGLYMRPDGYVRVDELLKLPKLQGLDYRGLENIVKDDKKSRYHLMREPDTRGDATVDVLWIRANQGHSIKSVSLDLPTITSPADIPTGIAVHGTTKKAWASIRNEGLSRMKRNHIHLAQAVLGSGVISGMRNSSQILIFINVQKALDAGIKFYMSANGVVLTDGDQRGFLSPQFFDRVETAKGELVPDWEPPADMPRSQATEIIPSITPSRQDASASEPTPPASDDASSIADIQHRTEALAL